MERNLLLSGFALGCAGWLCAFAATRRARAERDVALLPRYFVLAIVALPVLVFLATLPGRHPWTPGCGWGAGFLLGGIAAWLGLLVAPSNGRNAIPAGWTGAGIAGSWFAVLIPACGVQLWYRNDLVDTVTGIAIGWFCVAALAYFGSQRASTGDSDGAKLDPCALMAGTGFAVALCGTLVLGALRGTTEYESGMWGALATGLGAGAPLALMVATLPPPLLSRLLLRLPLAAMVTRALSGFGADEDARMAVARGARVGVASVVLLVLGWLLGTKVIAGRDAIYAPAIGLATALLASWLLSDRHANTQAAHTHAHWPLVVVVTIAGFMAAFQLLAGFGVGLAMMASWPIAALAISSAHEPGTAFEEEARAHAEMLTKALVFGLLLMLYRVVDARFEEELRGGRFTDHYALFGIVLGTVLPGMLAAFQARRRETAPLGSVVMSGLIALAVPAFLLSLWGPKCAYALLIGLALAIGVQRREESDEGARMGTALFATAVALGMCQWTAHILQVADLTRHERVHFLAWAVGSVIALLLASEYTTGLSARRRLRRQSPAAQGANR